MSKILRIIKAPAPNAYQAMVEVDSDVNAERLVVLDRISLYCIHNVAVAESNVTQLRVPLGYTANNNLLVGIVDDDGQYNSKFVDGIQAQLVDANVVTMKR